jgi:preprotein translocase SecE subunit
LARDRQRAKQRQAERRARRMADRGEPPAPPGQDTPPDVPGIDDPRASNPAPGVFPDVAVGAPPDTLGRTDRAYRDEPDPDELPPEQEEALEAEAMQEIEDWEVEPEEGEGEDAYAPRGRRGQSDADAPAKNRPRVVQFLFACWAELQRVQWPNRQALTTLTGVVLGFVLIAGTYLGLLDFVFSRLIQAIL